MKQEFGMSGSRHYTNGLPVEETRWQKFAGEPVPSDAVGAYTTQQLLKMNDDFVAAVERAFASGEESRAAAFATYKVTSRAA
jgi:hypothetical protein